jgi:acetyltransferase-like isoleucine patch superfamily enzyme
MSTCPAIDPVEARRKMDTFLRPDCRERLFSHPTPHPATTTGFCFCDRGLFCTMRVILRSILFQVVAALPFSRLTCAVFRWGGVQVGRGAYISVGVWIDPMFPHLVTIEDGAFIGSQVRLYTHEFRRDEFRAGRVVIRRGAMVGAHSIIACGVEVGMDATVGAAAVLARDVPDGHTAIGNPARILPQGKAP